MLDEVNRLILRQTVAKLKTIRTIRGLTEDQAKTLAAAEAKLSMLKVK